jgi:hypothetical protein
MIRKEWSGARVDSSAAAALFPFDMLSIGAPGSPLTENVR